jgi:DNA-binding winged helix-turn-helix (wHTH) protein
LAASNADLWSARAGRDDEFPVPVRPVTMRGLDWVVIEHAPGASPTGVARAVEDLARRAVSIVVVAPRTEDSDGLTDRIVSRLVSALRDLSGSTAAVLDCAEVHIDKLAHSVTVAGKTVPLARMEFRLLVALAEGGDRVQSRQALLRAVWGNSSDCTTRRVDVQVTRIRQKLGDAGRLIQTVRGVGYRFASSPARGGSVDAQAPRANSGASAFEKPVNPSEDAVKDSGPHIFGSPERTTVGRIRPQPAARPDGHGIRRG